MHHLSLSFARNISTHAPLRGATIFHVSLLQRQQISTHAPLRGATFVFFFFSRFKKFLLTRLCEARHELRFNSLHARNFYSRASARRDKLLYGVIFGLVISTHAPLRGATSTDPETVTWDYDFYSRASARRDSEKESKTT